MDDVVEVAEASRVSRKWRIGLIAAGAALLLGGGVIVATGLQGSSAIAGPSESAKATQAGAGETASATDASRDPASSLAASPLEGAKQVPPAEVVDAAVLASAGLGTFGTINATEVPDGYFASQVIVARGLPRSATITTDVDGSSASVYLEAPRRALIANSDSTAVGEWLQDGSVLIVGVVRGGATVVSSFTLSSETTTELATIPSAEPLRISLSTDGTLAALTVRVPGSAGSDKVSTVLVDLTSGVVQDLGNHSGATFVPGTHSLLCWTPSGSQAVLEAMTTTGSTSAISDVRSQADPGFGSWPRFAFSPDGTRVAYFAGTGDWDGQVRVVNVNGSGDTLVANVGWSASALEWSPLGDQLLFVSEGGGGKELTVVAIAEGQTQVANPERTVRLGNVTGATFLPDSAGVLLAMSSVDGTRSYLEVIDRSGEIYGLGSTGALTCALTWAGTEALGSFLWCGVDEQRDVLGSIGYEGP